MGTTSFKKANKSSFFNPHCIKRDLMSPPFKSGSTSNLGSPSNSELQGHPFSLSTLHMIPSNSPNGEMDESCI